MAIVAIDDFDEAFNRPGRRQTNVLSVSASAYIAGILEGLIKGPDEVDTVRAADFIVEKLETEMGVTFARLA